MPKKRYHQTKAYRAKEFYSDMGDRRRMEYEDSRMIQEDMSAVANLPQQVIQKQYPYARFVREAYLDDTSSGVDRQVKDDVMNNTIKKGAYPEKY